MIVAGLVRGKSESVADFVARLSEGSADSVVALFIVDAEVVVNIKRGRVGSVTNAGEAVFVSIRSAVEEFVGNNFADGISALFILIAEGVSVKIIGEAVFLVGISHGDSCSLGIESCS